MKQCPKCGASHERTGAFCSRSCANSRTFDDETRRRKSESGRRFRQSAEGQIIAEQRRSGNLGKVRSEEAKAQQSKTRRDQTLKMFEDGLVTERRVLRRILSERDGYKCSVCTITDWNGISITLQVDHRDGDPSNNQPPNLRLICPNCHSQTPTWGGRNKGSGRKTRGLKLS